jgi:Major Facilitator Superfamily
MIIRADEEPAQFRAAFFSCRAVDVFGGARSNHHRRGPCGNCGFARWTFLSRLGGHCVSARATIAAPLYGRMGDAFGRKRMLVWALGLFVAGSAGCAVAPTLAVLICARALQGFRGGGLMTLVALNGATDRPFRAMAEHAR